MPVSLDETPFILAGGALVTPKPASATAHVSAVTRLRRGGASLVRLRLDETTFLQADLDGEGEAELYRLFRRIDVVHPGSAEDWEQWLGAESGMVGWPNFQTKEGTLFSQRAWAPSEARIAPFEFVVEQGPGGAGGGPRRSMMLYARATGLDAPSPQVEYALLELVDDAGGKRIEIHAGIDVNAASLGIV